MAAATQTAPNTTTTSARSASISSSNGMSPLSPTVSGGGILANAHEAPKKPIKAADSGFTSALKAAFIPQQAGKLMKTNGKPLGKSFRRTSPLPTHGHEGGEVLKRDPRGQDAPCGDGVVLQSDADDEEEETLARSGDEGQINEGGGWSMLSAFTSRETNASSISDGQSTDSKWDVQSRGRSDTTTSSGVSSTMSRSSSTNPCSIKFAPLPSSGRLKRANSITIGVAARSHLLQSQGPARDYSSTNQQHQYRQQPTLQTASQPHRAPQSSQSTAQRSTPIVRPEDTIDLGEEFKKGALKAWRKMKRGNSQFSGANGSAVAGEKPAVVTADTMAKEVTGDRTPGRAQSPTTYASTDHIKDDLEEAEGTQTPKDSMQRRMSTGAFTGNQSLMELEEKRKREARGEYDEGREESAAFLQKLGRTHATTVAHHTSKDPWHPGMYDRQSKQDGQDKKVDIVDDSEETKDADDDKFDAARELTDEEEQVDDEESQEALKLADEAMASHSAKATKAGAVEKMERKQH